MNLSKRFTGPRNWSQPRQSHFLALVVCLFGINISHAAGAGTPLSGHYIIDGSQGRFRVMTSTSGLLRRFAHDHVFAVRQFEGTAIFDPDKPELASLNITAETASLESLDQLDQKSIQTINGEVRGKVLEAAKFPQITFRSTHIIATHTGAGRYTGEIDGDLTLHGITHPQRIRGSVTIEGNWLHAQGELIVRQTDHDLKPEKLLHGLIRVNDEVRLTFNIAAYQPILLTGIVQRYYADRSGFATAMELKMADGMSSFIRFAPNMGQYLIQTYPIGSNAALWTRENPQPTESKSATEQWNLIGWGRSVPVKGFQPPYLESEMNWLEARPWVVEGTPFTTVRGRLHHLVIGDHGEVAALALTSLTTTPSHPDILVTVPPEMRQGPPTTSADLPTFLPGTLIEARGLPIFPRPGAVSTYTLHLAASTIALNGKSATPLTFATPQHIPAFPYDKID